LSRAACSGSARHTAGGLRSLRAQRQLKRKDCPPKNDAKSLSIAVITRLDRVIQIKIDPLPYPGRVAGRMIKTAAAAAAGDVRPAWRAACA